MQVLPCRTQPPDRATELRHAPLAAKYEAYRDCLRWEFGFTCAVCLVHESDVDVRVQAEHVVRQADAPHETHCGCRQRFPHEDRLDGIPNQR